nr:hypothetical protein BaRGS_008705 [Batillaria attramentaria]
MLVQLVFGSVQCSDAGTFACVAKVDGDVVADQTQAQITLRAVWGLAGKAHALRNSGLKWLILVFDADAECGQTTGSSSLDAQKYVGWNESVLCCRLTDQADTSDVYAEACSEEIKLVPGTTGEKTSVADQFCQNYYVHGQKAIIGDVVQGCLH